MTKTYRYQTHLVLCYTGLDVNIHDVEVLDRHDFKDSDFGYEESYSYYDNPAHEHLLPDGTIFSNVITIDQLDTFNLQQW